MKNFIRKWLGVDEIEAKAISIEEALPDEYALRRMVGEAVESAISAKPDYRYWPYGRAAGLKNALTAALEKAAVPRATEAAEAQVNRTIGGEAFIDEIVRRIQRKQLSGLAAKDN